MTAPAFALPTESEEQGELEAMLGFALTDSTSDAQLDAIASDICRHLGYREADLARYEEARKAEIARINLHYSHRCGKLDAEIAQLRALGEEVAKRAKFPGKSKSRSVAFGSYGSRKVPEKVEIVDEARAFAWLTRTGNHGAFRTKTEIIRAEAKKLVLANLNATGEVADGFEHVAEQETFFIKAEG